MSAVCFDKDCETQVLEEGMVYRKIKAHGGDMMIVEVIFKKDAIGAEHTHPHEQCTYILEGEFEFTCDGEKHSVRLGDTLYFAPNAVHGCRCLSTAGRVIDVFSPQREDFL